MKYKSVLFPLAVLWKITFLLTFVLISIGLVIHIDLLISDPLNYFTYVFLGFYCIVVSNITVELRTSEEGLYINYFFSHYLIPWRDFVEIKRVKLSNIFLSRYGIWYIHVRNLPFIYRFFGLVISFKFIPCIILTPGIMDVEKLIKDMDFHLKWINKEFYWKR